MLHSRTKIVKGYGKRKNNVINVHDDFTKAISSPSGSRAKQNSAATSQDGTLSDVEDDAEEDEFMETQQTQRAFTPSPPKAKRKALSVIATKSNNRGTAKKQSALLDALLDTSSHTKLKPKPKLASANLPSILSTPLKRAKPLGSNKPKSFIGTAKPANFNPSTPTRDNIIVRSGNPKAKPAISSLSVAGTKSNLRMVTAPNSASSISSMGSYHTAISVASVDTEEVEEHVEEVIEVQEDEVIEVQVVNSMDVTEMTTRKPARKAVNKRDRRGQNLPTNSDSVDGIETHLASLTILEEQAESELDFQTVRARRPARARTTKGVIEISSSSGTDTSEEEEEEDEHDYTPPSREPSADMDEDTEDEEDRPKARRVVRGRQRSGTARVNKARGRVEESPDACLLVEPSTDIADMHDETGLALDMVDMDMNQGAGSDKLDQGSELDGLLALCNLKEVQPFDRFVTIHPLLELHGQQSSSSASDSLEARLAALAVSDPAPASSHQTKGKRGKTALTSKSTKPTSVNRFKKIGEASFSEVFGLWPENQGHAECEMVMKVIPLRARAGEGGSRGDITIVADKSRSKNGKKGKQPVVENSEEEQVSLSDVADVRREIEVTKLMSEMHDGFISFLGAYVVRGSYPETLLEAWDDFDAEKGSDSVRPDELPTDQLYAVILLSNGGPDLESFKFSSVSGWQQALSVITQLTEALVVAEAEGRFEHRDLHEGQVLVRSAGGSVTATIIDFGLSRVDHPQSDDVYFSPIPDDVFDGEGEQWDVYRAMRQMIMIGGGDWAQYHPFSNVLWLQYLTRVLLDSTPTLRKPKTKATAKVLARRDHSRSPIKRSGTSRPADKGNTATNEHCYETLRELHHMLTENVEAVLSEQGGRARKRKAGKAAARTASTMPLGVEQVLAWFLDGK